MRTSANCLDQLPESILSRCLDLLMTSLATHMLADQHSLFTLNHVPCLQSLEVPDVLALSVTQPYGGKEGEVPGFAGCGPLAQELTEQACDGSDDSLAIPLPHTRVMARKQGP